MVLVLYDLPCLHLTKCKFSICFCHAFFFFWSKKFHIGQDSFMFEITCSISALAGLNQDIVTCGVTGQPEIMIRDAHSHPYLSASEKN